MILGALGGIFMVFVGLEAGSEIDDFSGFPGETPEFRTRTSGTPKSLLLGAGGSPERPLSSGHVHRVRQNPSFWVQENNIHVDTIHQSS
jgi:hypothetical protein